MSLFGWIAARSPIAGRDWGGVLSAMGLLFGGIELLHVRAMSNPVGVVAEAVLPFVGAMGLVVAGHRLRSGDVVSDDVDAVRVAGWTGIGMVGLAAVFLWVLGHQVIRGGAFHHAHFILVNTLVAGAWVGFVIGTYDARSRAYRRSIHRERLRHDFLNRELRHHVLNGMNVILGRTARLDSRVDPPAADAVDTIRRRGEVIVDRVRSVRTVARTFSEEGTASLDRQDLSAVLTDVVERAADRYDAAVLSADVPDGVTVYADRGLPAVFENLVANAVEHSDADPPRVDVSLVAEEAAAVVRIADNGPGLPDAHRAALAGDDPLSGEAGVGIGLALADVVVDRSGGWLRFDDNEPTGTVVSVGLDRAR